MTPAVRRLLREHDLYAPPRSSGRGGGGRITREDVLTSSSRIRTGRPSAAPAVGSNGRRSAAPAAPPLDPCRPGGRPAPRPARPQPAAGRPGRPARIEFPAGADEVLVPMTQMRKGIAAQMTRALAVPHAYVQMEVDVTNLVTFRERDKRDYQAREGRPQLRALRGQGLAEALKRNPTFNAHWTDGGPPCQAPGQHRHRRRGRRRPDRAGRPRRRPSVDQRPEQAPSPTWPSEPGRQAPRRRFRWRDVHRRQHRLPRHEHGHADHQRARGRHRDDGGITKRPVVVETPQGDVIAIRPIMNMVLASITGPTTAPGGAAFLRPSRTWLEASSPRLRSTEDEPTMARDLPMLEPPDAAITAPAMPSIADGRRRRRLPAADGSRPSADTPTGSARGCPPARTTTS